jgi:hypothetical protein
MPLAMGPGDGDPSTQDLVQLLDRQGFGAEVVHARGEACLPI